MQIHEHSDPLSDSGTAAEQQSCVYTKSKITSEVNRKIRFDALWCFLWLSGLQSRQCSGWIAVGISRHPGAAHAGDGSLGSYRLSRLACTGTDVRAVRPEPSPTIKQWHGQDVGGLFERCGAATSVSVWTPGIKTPSKIRLQVNRLLEFWKAGPF